MYQYRCLECGKMVDEDEWLEYGYICQECCDKWNEVL
jgi:hypothetical protein